MKKLVSLVLAMLMLLGSLLSFLFLGSSLFYGLYGVWDSFNAKKEAGEVVDETEMFTQLSLVNKTAINKIEEFETLISKRPELLEKSIIFVQTMEYGKQLQEVLIKHTDKYHTYYAVNDSVRNLNENVFLECENLEKINLENFAEGKINCLLTCKKVSEGIDISSVTNIFLFASDRSKLVTTQRIGRALRLDKNNPDKKANVIDFILDDIGENDNNADNDRRCSLQQIGQVTDNGCKSFLSVLGQIDSAKDSNRYGNDGSHSQHEQRTDDTVGYSTGNRFSGSNGFHRFIGGRRWFCKERPRQLVVSTQQHFSQDGK